MPVHASPATLDEHRRLVGSGRVVAALAALVAVGLSGWAAWLHTHAPGALLGLPRATLAGVGAAYFLAVSLYAGHSSVRVDTRTEATLEQARQRFGWSIVALCVPLLLLCLFELFGADALNAIGGPGGDRRQKPP